MRKELAKTYAPKEFEDRIYHNWEEKGYFHAEIDPKKKPYTIVIPPPNITGQLHMGHALDNTLQDILIRWRRMQGYSALWLPGTDHASIATEAKIVGKMKEEGLTKDVSFSSSRSWEAPATGSASALPLTRAAPEPFRKCSWISTTRALFITA